MKSTFLVSVQQQRKGSKVLPLFIIFSITPNLIVNEPSVPPVVHSSSTGTSSMIVVDYTKPVTSVQIRLVDGQRYHNIHCMCVLLYYID